MRHILSVALAGALSVTAASSSLAAERIRGNTVTASGCTSFKVPFCTMLATGKSTYVLTGANPAIPHGIGVSLVGEKGDYNFLCGAPTLKVAKWKPNKMKCPK